MDLSTLRGRRAAHFHHTCPSTNSGCSSESRREISSRRVGWSAHVVSVASESGDFWRLVHSARGSAQWNGTSFAGAQQCSGKGETMLFDTSVSTCSQKPCVYHVERQCLGSSSQGHITGSFRVCHGRRRNPQRQSSQLLTHWLAVLLTQTCRTEQRCSSHMSFTRVLNGVLCLRVDDMLGTGDHTIVGKMITY